MGVLVKYEARDMPSHPVQVSYLLDRKHGRPSAFCGFQVTKSSKNETPLQLTTEGQRC